MTIQAVLLPVFLEVALIYALLGLMAFSRNAAFRAGLPPGEVALSGDAYPPRCRQFANAYANQFEIPVLFIAAVILAIVVHQASTVFVVLEWLFIAAQVAQAIVHTTTNTLPLRGVCFMVSAACTAGCWILIALGVFGLA